MHTSHAAFTCREEHRQELLSFAEQHELVELACTGTAFMKPREATAMAIRALVHRLTAYTPPAPRARPCPEAATTAAESPIPSIAP